MSTSGEPECGATRYAKGPCEGPPKFEVVYSVQGVHHDSHPACFRHGLAEVDRHHKSGGMAACDLVERPTDEVDSVEAARIAGVTRTTWTAYVRARRPVHHPPPLPVRTIGRTPVWSEQAVRAWADTRPGRGARLDLTTDRSTP